MAATMGLRPFGRLIWQTALQSNSMVALQFPRSFAAVSQQLAAIKDLRERSGAPIAEVKAALVQAGWDMDGAFQELRKKGMAAATKKAARHAAEGLVSVAHEGNSLAIVEVNSETDFVARNQHFTELVPHIARAALRVSPTHVAGDGQVDTAALLDTQLTSNSSVADAINALVGNLRENIKVRRAYRISTSSNGVLASYLHASSLPSLGRMGTVLGVECAPGNLADDAKAQVQDLCTKIAMHATAMKPAFLSRDTVSQEALEAEKQILREQAARQGKPANVVEKMVAGRLTKFYEESCLLEQNFVLEDTKKVQAVLAELGQRLGQELHVTGYVRLQCGEGLERSQKDFASEVAEIAESAAA